tara:strand:+ start:29 stop:436 length:408 start_codon:yes stop_codon:yes gene_type:complete
MELKNFLKVLSLLLVTLLLTNCSTFQLPAKTVVKTEYVEKVVPLQPHPKPLNMQNVEWYVVTEQNFADFITKYKKEHGEEWVFYAISVRGYEAMALNMADIKRYLEQNQKLILYYEKAVSPNGEEESKEDGKKEE